MNILLNIFDKYLQISAVLGLSITFLSLIPIKKICQREGKKHKFINGFLIMLWLVIFLISGCLAYLALMRNSYVIVPNVVGKSYKKSLEILQDREMVVESPDFLLDDEKVVMQSISPGDYCRKKTKIKLKTNISFEWFKLGVDNSYIKEIEGTEPIDSLTVEDGGEILTFSDSYFAGYKGESTYFFVDELGLFMMGWNPYSTDYLNIKNKLLNILLVQYGQFSIDKTSEKDKEFSFIDYIWQSMDGDFITMAFNDEKKTIYLGWYNKYIDKSAYDINDFLYD